MLYLSKKLDHLLLDLAWSLWTELGVAGVERRHQNFLITIEELILLTALLGEIDPRLRDESLDWCSQYHHLISTSRLKSLIKSYFSSLRGPFSTYSATLNSFSQAGWPIFQDSSPLNVLLSHKSCLRPLESTALLNIRARSTFGTGARADLLTFFLIHAKSDFSASDLVEIGYSKRNIAEILDELYLSKILDKFLLRNQHRYRLIKNDELLGLLGPLPEYTPSWRLIFEVLFSLQDCIKRSLNSSKTTQAIEIRNLLITRESHLKRLNLSPPVWKNDYQAYLDSFGEWLIDIVSKLASGEFPSNLYLTDAMIH